MIKIDKETYKVKDINRYKNVTPKTQIVLASSLRKDSNHIVRLQHKDFGNTKRWNTYTISRDGTIYEHYDPKLHSDFLDVKEGDKQSISIVLENMGSLIETSDGDYVNFLNEICDKKNVLKKTWQGYNFWEKYTTKQLKSCVELCKKLCDDFGIPKKLVEFKCYHKDISNYKGIVFKCNYIEDNIDSNPSLSISEFNEMLNK